LIELTLTLIINVNSLSRIVKSVPVDCRFERTLRQNLGRWVVSCHFTACWYCRSQTSLV